MDQAQKRIIAEILDREVAMFCEFPHGKSLLAGLILMTCSYIGGGNSLSGRFPVVRATFGTFGGRRRKDEIL